MKQHSLYIITLLVIFLAIMNSVSAENSSSDLISDIQYDNNVDINIADDNQKSYQSVSSDLDDDNLKLNDNSQESNSILKGNSSSDLKIYKLGYDVTRAADKLLNFSSADDILVITTAGMTWIDNKTTESALGGIVDASNNYVSYGKGNILTLSSTRKDPTNIAFFIKKDNSLTMAFYKNGSLTPIFYGNAGPTLSASEWKKLQKALGDEDAYSYISISNAWSAGMPNDVLTQATYHGHVCTGLISGQAMIQTLLTYYPPKDEFGLPLEHTSYYVLGVPGGSEDDAFTWSLDITPGKRAYIGIDTMVNKAMTGFIRWNTTSNTGIIIIMSYNETAIKENFKKIFGLNPDASATNDLKYQNWLINKLHTNPTSLVTMLYEFKGLTKDNLEYLMGLEIGKGNVVKSAHGLDMDYILGLNLTKATRETKVNITETKLSDEKLKQIGIDACNKAIEYFTSQGITIKKDLTNFYVLTSAGYVRINGTPTSMIFDGIYEVLGSALYKKTLLPVHTPIWKDLVFDFYWVDANNVKNDSSFSLKYDVDNDELIITGNTSKNANYILQNAIKYDPPYDVLIGWLFHNHVCGGSAPGYLIADYIYENFPTNENESYIYLTTNANCKDDVISRVLGVSPGMGTYYNLRYDNNKTNSTNVGIAIKWNSKTKTGELIIINLDNWGAGALFKKGSNMYEEYIKLYKKDYSSPNLISRPQISITSRKEINEEMLNKIIGGATDTKEGNSIAYIMGLPDKLPIKNEENNNNKDNKKTPINENKKKTDGKLINNSSSSSNSINSNTPTTGTYGKSYGEGLSVGVSKNTINANNEPESSDASSSDGKTYEISKTGANKEINSNSIVFAILAILILGGIVGYGYIRKNRSK